MAEEEGFQGHNICEFKLDIQIHVNREDNDNDNFSYFDNKYND